MTMERGSTLGARSGWGRGLEPRVAAIIAVAAACLVSVPNVLAGQNSDSSGVRLFEAGKFKEA